MTKLGGTGVSENTDFDDDLAEVLGVLARLNPTLAEAVANVAAKEGDIVSISDRGNGWFEYKTGQTPNTFDIVDVVLPGLSLVLDLNQPLSVIMFGAVGDSDGTTGSGNDDTGAMQANADVRKYIGLPIGFKFRITAPIIYTDGVWIGGSRDIRGTQVGSVIIVDDVAGASTDKFITHAKKMNDILIQGTSKKSTGLAIERSDNVEQFLGWTEYRNIRVTGCRLGIHIGNIFNCKLDNVISEENVFGMDVKPVQSDSSNGFFTTLTFDKVVLRSNDDYGLDIDPPTKSPTWSTRHFNIETNNVVSGTFQARIKNCDPFSGSDWYIEGRESVNVVEWVAGNVGSVDSVFMNKCGDFAFGTGTANIKFKSFKITAVTAGVIQANGGSNQKLTFENSTITFTSATLPSLGELTLNETTADGTLFSNFTKGSSVKFNMNGDDFKWIKTRGHSFSGVTVNANSPATLVTDTFVTDIMLNTTAFANIDGVFEPSIQLSVTPANTGDTDFYRVVAVNTSNSNIALSDGDLSVTFIRRV